MSLVAVAEAAAAELARRARQDQYKNDPVLWARDYLGVQLWRKQRDIMWSVLTNRNTAVAAGHGVGKDLPLDTPIPTPTGWSTVGELQPGDAVYDENGDVCYVTGKSEVFSLPLFETTFSDGAKAVSSASHEWNTIDRKAAKKARRRGVTDWRDEWAIAETRETGDIRDTLTYSNGSRPGANHIVPIAGALQGSTEVPIDPYVVGAWLGDGTSCRAEMTIGEEGRYIIDEFKARGVDLTPLPSGPCRYTFARQGFLERFREHDMMNNKHIPSDYQRASIPDRLDLLRGLMDTDGFVAHGTVCGIDLMNRELAYDAVELIRGLGVRASITPARTYLDGRDVGVRYRIVFNPTFSPFSTGSYKDEAHGRSGTAFTSASRRTMRTIRSVEPVATVPTQCIEVDSASHMYLATEHLLPTHNSFVAGIISAWWVDVHPIDEVFLASTAPSMDQVNILWDNIRRVHTLAAQRYEQGLVDHPLPGNITGDNKWKLADGTIIGQGRKPPDAKSDVAFQGRHATYLLAIGDEAVGISAGFLEALGNIATGEFNRQLLLANPTDPGSAMAKIWEKEMPTWARMHISVFDSPRITNEPGFDISLAPALSGMEYVQQALETFGSEDDPRYIARVKGEWAFDAGNTVFTAEELAKAKNTVVLPERNGIVEFGVDIARMGADSSIVYEARRGDVWTTDENGDADERTGRQGIKIRRLAKWQKAPLVGTNPANPGSAQRVDALAEEKGASVLKIDAAGIGSGVIDGLIEIGNPAYEVVEIFGGAATTDPRAYVNMRAEQFFEMKKWMSRGDVDLDPEDEELFGELQNIQYEMNDKSVIKIESKETMRKKGRKSPDHADACWYAFYDAFPFLENPANALNSGDQLVFDPFDLTNEAAYGSIGAPM